MGQWLTVMAGAMMSVILSSQASAPGRVRIDSGELQGTVVGDIVSFKNIPYAAPPVGNLRWRPPRPIAPWRGVRSAMKVGALCMQTINPTDNGVGPPLASTNNRVFEFTNKAPTITQQPHAEALDVIAQRY